MIQLKPSMWIYQRVILICFITVFVAYSMVFNIPLYTITIFLIFIVPSVINPQYVCRSIFIPFSKRILVNYCGFVLPFIASVIIMIYSNINLKHLILLTSMSTAFASLHTYVTKRMILVNILRYCLSFVSLSIAILSNVHHILPFASVMGIFIGSDLIPFLILNKLNRNNTKAMIVGGFMALDSIALSFVLVTSILMVFHLLVPW